MLSGEAGAGVALAMRLVVRAAEVTAATRLIPINRAHLDSCLYHGQASLDFVGRLAADGAGVAVPTSLNVGGVDLLHPDLWRGEQVAAARGRELMAAYRSLGCLPTFTCAPYQLPQLRPRLGEQVAWGESNAIAFCNSVLGARTNRYGDFIDAACAVTGMVPEAGLHVTAERRAVIVLKPGRDVPPAFFDDDSFYPVLGLVLGRRAGSSVAAIVGLPPGLGDDRLKAIAAAGASSGSVALFHVIGSTPEAPSLEAALHGSEPELVAEIGMGELRAARSELMTADPGARLRAVSLGTPHASLPELRRIAELLDGSRRADGVELLVSTSRDLLAAADEEGIGDRLRAAGVELLVDTCSYIAPILHPGGGAVMTDSGKWAYYAPGNIGAEVMFGSTAECVASAVAGRAVRFPSAWDEA
ncbi:MAG: aconitase X catalytic domain-containing protein [Chloroflexota bacterium]|nr:aconitase X catalytic domain-containing protein [Chloroflexota bacterium]